MKYIKIAGSVLEQLYGIFNGVPRIFGKISGEQYILHSIR
jgi:hypothetical protein